MEYKKINGQLYYHVSWPFSQRIRELDKTQEHYWNTEEDSSCFVEKEWYDSIMQDW